MTKDNYCLFEDCTTRHNHCDFCHEDLKTDIEFHEHYPKCGEKHNWKRNLAYWI